KYCAHADWDVCHSVLCTGDGSKLVRTKALSKIIEHANKTNDIFLLDAKAISSTILKYKKLKAANTKEKEKNNMWWDSISLPDDVDTSDEAAFRTQNKATASELNKGHKRRALHLIYAALPIILGHNDLELRSLADIAHAKCNLSESAISEQLRLDQNEETKVMSMDHDEIMKNKFNVQIPEVSLLRGKSSGSLASCTRREKSLLEHFLS
ncbi:hypothetical protein Tco_1052066, partial [Tanacetum coccineum]